MGWFHSLFLRPRIHSEIDRELQFHLEEDIAARIAKGQPREEARREALLLFGGPTQIQEECREVHGVPMAENFLQDVRYAVRSLIKTPGFTVLALLILAGGIGANTAIFTVANGILLRQLPYPDAGRLFAVSSGTVRQAAILMELRKGARLADYAGYGWSSEVNLTGEGEPVRLTSSTVSSGFFSVLGVQPLFGRPFREDEERPGRGRALLLSYDLWRSRYRGDPAIAGRRLTIDGVVCEVVGVMPAGFSFSSPATQLWMPLEIDPASTDYWFSSVPVFGRLRQGVTLEQANAEFRGIVGRLFESAYKKSWPVWGAARLAPMIETVVRDVRKRIILLLAIAALVLLIACANFANLLVVRNAVRRKELAVRAALGASRPRILQQLLTESALAGLAGGALGLIAAMAGTTLLKAWLPKDTPRLAEVAMDWRVLAFTTTLALLTGIGFGLLPALRATRHDTGGDLQASARATSGRHPLLAGFVVIQIAVSLVVVMGAAVFAKTILDLAGVDPGFSASHLLTVKVTPPPPLCRDAGRCLALYRDIVERVRALPGVASVSAINSFPLAGDMDAFAVEVEDHPYHGQAAPLFSRGEITPGYLATMRIPLLAGRTFTEADARGSERVAMVSAATAKRYWPGQNPIGKHVKAVWLKDWYRVVGLVADVKYTSLGVENPDIEGALYLPYGQGIGESTPGAMTLAIRTIGNPLDLAAPVRTAVSEVNRETPLSHLQTGEEIVSNSLSEPRSTTSLLVCFAGLALLLSGAGTYGVVSYGVARRVREIGVRMALGAAPSDVRKLVLNQSLRYACAGLLLGAPAAVAATRLLRHQLEVDPADPVLYAAGAALVAAIALIAGWVPARRAMRLDPSAAIRQE